MEFAILRLSTLTAYLQSRSLPTVHTMPASQSSHCLQYEIERASHENQGKSMKVNSTQSKRGNLMRTNISAILLIVVSGTLLSAALVCAQGQVATNVGEDAKKYNGA